MLRDIVKDAITFSDFVNAFKSSNINGVYNFLKRKAIECEADF